MPIAAPTRVPDAFGALSPLERLECFRGALADIRRIRNRCESANNIRLDDPEAYLGAAWKRLAEISREFDLSSPEKIRAIIRETARHLIFEHMREIFPRLKNEVEFQEGHIPTPIFEIDNAEAALQPAGALRLLRERIGEEESAVARLALAMIALLVSAGPMDGEPKYLQLVHTEGKRRLRLPRMGLSRRDIAAALGIAPTRVSKVKAFIQAQAREVGASNYWALLRFSDERGPDALKPADVTHAKGRVRPTTSERGCKI